MIKKIYVTEPFNTYFHKILEVEETYQPEVNDDDIVWMITSVNGEEVEGDWFWKCEFEKLDYVLVDASFEKLLAFL